MGKGCWKKTQVLRLLSPIFSRIFFVCAPRLMGAICLHPLEAGAIFLHNGLPGNGTCSVTGGRITY